MLKFGTSLFIQLKNGRIIMDTDFREELIKAITVVATTTGMTVDECIKQALVLLEEEKYEEKYEDNR